MKDENVLKHPKKPL